MDKALTDLSYKPEDPGSYGGLEKLVRSAMKAGVQNFTRGPVK